MPQRVVADGAHRALGTMLSLLLLSLTLGLATPSSGNQYLMRIELKQLLLSLGAVATAASSRRRPEAARAAECVARLEGYSSASDTWRLAGSWDLILTDVEPFRASPFWWTLQSALDDFRPGAGERVLPAHRLATAVGEIGRVRQCISPDGGGGGTLTSEVDIRAGFLPGLPLGVRGTVVTTAEFNEVSAVVPSGDSSSSSSEFDGTDDGGLDELLLLGGEIAAELVSTEVRSSTLMLGYAGGGGETSRTNLPMPFLDAQKLPVGNLLNRVGQQNKRSSSSSESGEPRRPQLRTTYLDDDFRVSRTEDEHFFVFVRAE